MVSNYRNLHYDAIKLSVKKHILFAKDVVLKVLSLEKENAGNSSYQPLIKRVVEKKQFEMIEKWIQQGDIQFEELKDKQKEAILNQREKALRAQQQKVDRVV